MSRYQASRRPTAPVSVPSSPRLSATTAAASGPASSARSSARSPSAATRRPASARTNASKRSVTWRGRYGGTYGSRWRAWAAPSSDSMLGPTTRAVEKRGSSTVNVSGSRSTSTAAARPVTRNPPIAGTAATGDAARNRARCGWGSPASVVDGQRGADASGVGHRVTADEAEPYVLRSVVLSTLPVALRGSSSTHLDAGRALEVGQPLPGEGDQLGRRGLAVTGHGGDDRLAPALVGQPEDGDLAHGRVADDDLLDLDRVDVLAAGDDHVLLAVDERDVAVLVDLAEVAGVEPAAAERVGRRPGQHPVAGEDVLAAHEQLADVADRDVPVVGVDQAGLDVLQRAADRAQLVLDVLGVEDGHRRRRLGQAEALLERHAPAVEELDQRERRRGAAGQRHVQRRQVVVVEAGDAHQGRPHRRHEELQRHPVLGHRGQERRRVERRHDDVLGADVHERQAVHAEPADVEHRRRRDGDVGRAGRRGAAAGRCGRWPWRWRA